MARLFLLLLLLLPFASSAQEIAAAEGPVVVDPAPPVVPESYERVSSPYLEVYGAPGSLAVLLEVSRHGSASLPRLASDLGVAIGGGIHVVVAPTQRAFYDLQPGGVPEWADGTAWPGLGQIFLRRPGIRGAADRPIETVLDHELVHVLLGRAFAPQRPPRWLQEGIAQVQAGEFTPETTRRLARGMLGEGLLSLEELTLGFPEDPRRAQLAYAQSADFVSWLDAEYGEDAVRTVVREMRGGADVRAAVRAATGLFLEDVDRAWRSRLEQQVAFRLTALGSTEVLWGLAAAGAVVGLILARRRIRRRMARLAEQERIRDALVRALWRGDDAG